MRIAAFDLSLTATGWATSFSSFGPNGEVMTSGVLEPAIQKLTGMPRILYIRDQVLQLASRADLVLIEGFAYGAKGNAIIELGMLGGVVRVGFVERGIRYVEIPPATLKKFATNNGNASKDLMLATAIRRLGYLGHSHDEADALWLLEMAHRWYLDDRDEWRSSEAGPLNTIKWPPLNPTEEVPA